MDACCILKVSNEKVMTPHPTDLTENRGQVIKKIMNLQERNQKELVYIKHRDTKFCNYLSEKMPGVHRVRGFAAYERREINSVSYGQENKNSVSPCLCVSYHCILFNCYTFA